MAKIINLNEKDISTSKASKLDTMIIAIDDIEYIHQRLNELANEIIHGGNNANSDKINIERSNIESLNSLLENGPDIIKRKTVDCCEIIFRLRQCLLS